LIAVTHHEIVLHIKGGQRFAERRLERIHLFADVGRLILGFAKRVCRQHIQPLAVMAQRDLQRIVVGIAHGGLVGVASEV
jgi:hypothetical protein